MTNVLNLSKEATEGRKEGRKFRGDTEMPHKRDWTAAGSRGKAREARRDNTGGGITGQLPKVM